MHDTLPYDSAGLSHAATSSVPYRPVVLPVRLCLAVLYSPSIDRRVAACPWVLRRPATKVRYLLRVLIGSCRLITIVPCARCHARPTILHQHSYALHSLRAAPYQRQTRDYHLPSGCIIANDRISFGRAIIFTWSGLTLQGARSPRLLYMIQPLITQL